MTSLVWILVALGFMALVMSVIFGVTLWRMVYGREAKLLDERLEKIGARRRQEETFVVARHYSRIPWLDDRLGRVEFLRNSDKLIVSAGYSMMLDRWLFNVLLAVLIVALATVSAQLSAMVVLGASFLTLLAPFLFLRRRVASRAKKFEEQLPDVLEFIARAMQAGHSFGAAIQMAATESPEPIAGEFARTQAEINFGVPMNKALGDLAERINSPDLRFFAVAVAINREVGGDLAGLLEGIATLIRQRIDMRASVQAMTAEGRFSALVLVALPFLVAGLMMLVNPSTIIGLWMNPVGRNMIFGGLILMALGAVWMRSMIRIRV